MYRTAGDFQQGEKLGSTLLSVLKMQLPKF